MTVNPTSPPPGWYPAPDQSSGTWWWDGTRWTPPVEQGPQRPAMTNGLAKLAVATQALLGVSAAMSLATIGIESFGINAVTTYLEGDESSVRLLDAYDAISPVVSILSLIALLATAVVWVLWQYRVAKQFPGQTRRTPGWHVGSWFVPVVSAWFPYQNISDLWRAGGRTRPGWQIVWWLCWLVSGSLLQASSRLLMSAETLDQFRVAMSVSLAGEIFLLAAAPLAWLIVRGITKGITQRADSAVLSATMAIDAR